MSKLQWPHLKEFMSAKRVPLYPTTGKAKKATGAFLQEYMNLKFYWILKAGHMVNEAINCKHSFWGSGRGVVYAVALTINFCAKKV